MIIRALVEDYYDLQRMRLEAASQVRAKEQEVSEQELAFFKDKISKRLEESEKDIQTYLGQFLKEQPLYMEWLKDIKGIGVVISAGLIAFLESAEKFSTISKLWMYSGLAVDDEGRAMRRKSGQTLRYNPKMKVLAWKIGESFVKNGEGYRAIYEDCREEYDKKWLTPEDCGSKGCANKGKGSCMKGHRYAAAKRKTVKIFLAHLWQTWRELEGLPKEPVFIIGRHDKNGQVHTHEIPVVMK